MSESKIEAIAELIRDLGFEVDVREDGISGAESIHGEGPFAAMEGASFRLSPTDEGWDLQLLGVEYLPVERTGLAAGQVLEALRQHLPAVAA